MSATTTPKIRPIIFDSEMIRAILAGKKTQTRRYVKTQEFIPYHNRYTLTADCDTSPYGDKGDHLWVQESFIENRAGEYLLHANASEDFVGAFRWRPAKDMPRSASRILLEVTNTSVQYIKYISANDAKAEGIIGGPMDDFGSEWWKDYAYEIYAHTDPRSSFRSRSTTRPRIRPTHLRLPARPHRPRRQAWYTLPVNDF